MAPSHVLVPLDGSPLANEALSHALETFDSRITVLNVVTPMDVATSEGGLLEPSDQRLQDARERTDRLTRGARIEAEARNRTIETAVETGEPAQRILEYVAAQDVDHVIMGGHGGDGIDIAGRLLGTVATTVVADAPVSVTVVR